MIAIIPARGGSKRIPRKNIKDFLGKPVIAYSIDVALKSKLFDEVMVSTDDKEIAEIALKYGAKVPFFRSIANSDDKASTMEVIHEVLADYLEKSSRKFKYVCCIYPTASLIQINQLKKGFLKLKENNLSVVYPIVPFSYPIWRGVTLEADETVKMLWPEYENTRTQDLTTVYHDAGQWYWFDMEKINKHKIGSIILNEEEVQDIDTMSDWRLAELKYKLLNNIII